MSIKSRIRATGQPDLGFVPSRRRGWRAGLPAGVTVAIGLLAGLLAGCGGGAQASSPSKVMSSALAYANCMRSHGVPDFPDPNGQGAIEFNTGQIDPNSPGFDRALNACAKYMGGAKAPTPAQRAKTLARALIMAECMRSHGVPAFPDPASGDASSSFAPPGSTPAGLDPRSPIFQSALAKCGRLLTGRAGNRTSLHA